MRLRSLLVFVLLLATFLFAATPTLIVGVVLESETDLPVKNAVITYVSGKKLGETDSDGCKNGSKKRCQICACSLRYRKIQDECQDLY